ncbi:Cullin [Mycena metata]|uniref:Cullin n=1 Tax=Mycena metata TaxID=1033252 RepID=A0AAD7HGZ2_9AGAR|nr:Cullin [Mycena metata]
MVPPPSLIDDALLIGDAHAILVVVWSPTEGWVAYYRARLAAPQNASTLRDEPLFRCYAAEWDRYTTGANNLNRLFIHLNRYWVKRERNEGKRAVYQVYTCDGGTVDQTLLKRIIDSYVSLGLDAGDPNKERLDVYREKFESPFLVATESYYSAEATVFLKGRACLSSGGMGNILEYLKKAEGRLKEEGEWVVRYLHAKTRTELVSQGSRPSILAHADLQRMCALLARIPEGLEPLGRKFEVHVKTAGLAAIEGVGGGLSGTAPDDLSVAPAKKGAAAAAADAQETTTKNAELDPKAYVDALLAVHEKNERPSLKRRWIRRVESLLIGMRLPVSWGVCSSTAYSVFRDEFWAEGDPLSSQCTSAAKSRELLAKHADMLLRMSNKMAGEGDLERTLNRVIILFKYLEDKYVFRTFYTASRNKT